MPTARSLAARKAAQTRWSTPDPNIDRDLAAAKIAGYVKKVVADSPPLTEEQRARIASLLAPVGGGHDVA